MLLWENIIIGAGGRRAPMPLSAGATTIVEDT